MAAIKKQPLLKPLSRAHHQGLLLSWKIRSGFKKEVSIERIKKYCDFYFEQELIHHFKIEELHIFPLLSADDELVKKALTDHRKLKRCFLKKEADMKSLVAIEEELEKHIRFEKRILFNKILAVASEKELLNLEKIYNSMIPYDLENWEDKFWE